jgi:hypothetical protein
VTEQNSHRGPISRRDVFRYGLGASTLIALGPLLRESSGTATTLGFPTGDVPALDYGLNSLGIEGDVDAATSAVLARQGFSD